MENVLWQSATGCTSCQPSTDISLEGYVTHDDADVAASPCKCRRMGLCSMGRPGQ